MKFVGITLHRRCTSVRFSIQHPRRRVPWADHRWQACGWVGSSNPPARLPAIVGPG